MVHCNIWCTSGADVVVYRVVPMLWCTAIYEGAGAALLALQQGKLPAGDALQSLFDAHCTLHCALCSVLPSLCSAHNILLKSCAAIYGQPLQCSPQLKILQSSTQHCKTVNCTVTQHSANNCSTVQLHLSAKFCNPAFDIFHQQGRAEGKH